MSDANIPFKPFESPDNLEFPYLAPYEMHKRCSPEFFSPYGHIINPYQMSLTPRALPAPYGMFSDRCALPAPYLNSNFEEQTAKSNAMDAASKTKSLWQATSGMWQVAQPVTGERRPLRVVHIGATLVRGGVEQWLHSLCRFSDTQRVQLTRCLLLTSYIDPRMAEEFQVPIEVVGPQSLERAAKACDVFLISVPSWTDALNRNRCWPKLTIAVAHGDSQWVRERLEDLRPNLQHVVSVSQRVRDLVCHDYPGSVIHNGVDASRVACCLSREESRRELGFASGDFVLGYVGRMSPEKQPQRILEAVARGPQHHKALMVGWGPLLPELEKYAATYLPGRYRFISADRFLGDAFRAMDAFCLPSLTEGFALVLLEAMLCGIPVMATAVGAAPEIIQNRINGILLADHPDEIQRAVLTLERYPDWARGLAEAGRRYADAKGHALRMAREYAELFHRLWIERQTQTAA